MGRKNWEPLKDWGGSVRKERGFEKKEEEKERLAAKKFFGFLDKKR